MAGSVHVTSDIENASSDDAEPGVMREGYCKTHEGRLVVYFCTTHGAFCCLVCRNEEHNRCKDIEVLPKRKMAKVLREFDSTFPGDKAGPLIIASAFLSDGRLLLIDSSNKKFKVFGPDFRYQYGKHFDVEIKRMAVFDKDEVSVSAHGDRSIYRMSVDKPITDTGKIALNFPYNCPMYVDKKTLVVLDSKYNALHYYNIAGEKLKTVVNSQLQNVLLWPNYCCLDETKSVLYVSNENNSSVCAIDLNSRKVLFTYKHRDLKTPAGVTVDKDGYLYVCGRVSNNIHQVAPSGEHVGILLSQKNGIQTPRTLSFHPDGKTFVVDGCPGKVKVFQMETVIIPAS